MSWKLTVNPPVWSWPIDALDTSLPGNSGGKRLEVDGLALAHLRRPEGNEVESSGLAHQLADRVGIGHARELDDDPVRALRLDDGLRHAGRVHAILDDVADHAQRSGVRLHAVDLLRQVFDAESALEVEPELRLELAPAAGVGVAAGDGGIGEEVDEEGC